MLRRILACVAVAGVLAAGATYAAAPAPALPPLTQCEVERVALQAQLVELRSQLVAAQTQLDRQALAAERARIEGTLPVIEGQRWDWNTLRFMPAPSAAETRPQ